MGSTLTNGIYLPAEGERNCYEGLAANWTALDGLIGGYNAHVGNATIHVTAADKEAWNGKADASALTAHTGDTTIHVTSADKAKWNTVTSKADDSDVVHKSGNETIGGAKTFSDDNMIKKSSPKVLLINTDQTGNTAPSSNTASSLRFDGGTVNNFGGLQCEFLTTGENRLSNYVKDITTAKINSIQQRANSTTAMTVFNADLIIPSTDGITALGSSSKRWKDVQTYLFNGINPGALFLPQDRTARVDISAYFTNTANGATNQVTSPADGYIYLAITDVVTIHCFSQNASNLTHYGQTFARPSAGQLHCLFPVRKNDNVAVQWDTTAAAVTVSNAFFIPCKGNI